MLQNAYFLAKIGADTAENEQRSAEILPTDGADGADGEPGPARQDPGTRRRWWQEPWLRHPKMMDWWTFYERVMKISAHGQKMLADICSISAEARKFQQIR